MRCEELKISPHLNVNAHNQDLNVDAHDCDEHSDLTSTSMLTLIPISDDDDDAKCNRWEIGDDDRQ